MIRLLWELSAHARYYLRRYMPTNIALDAIRTRRGLKWGLPAMLLAAPYLLGVYYCVTVVEDGGPGWLNLVVLLFCWNALKFLAIGPISVILIVRIRIREAFAGRGALRQREALESAESATAGTVEGRNHGGKDLALTTRLTGH
ncbi:sulfate permease [Protaetiibacter intestinalis]|uniref:sulfate permease n=1 Tax=Protaetiibacter intestinalis TaxID=2419774 RepID=UPI001D03A84A|nr:sulfate permease [Protaetiibacter intestinalis]